MYITISSTAGEKVSKTLKMARIAAAEMKSRAEIFDTVRIFKFLKGCSGSDCTCSGQIHPRREFIESI